MWFWCRKFATNSIIFYSRWMREKVDKVKIKVFPERVLTDFPFSYQFNVKTKMIGLEGRLRFIFRSSSVTMYICMLAIQIILWGAGEFCHKLVEYERPELRSRVTTIEDRSAWLTLQPLVTRVCVCGLIAFQEHIEENSVFSFGNIHPWHWSGTYQVVTSERWWYYCQRSI